LLTSLHISCRSSRIYCTEWPITCQRVCLYTVIIHIHQHHLLLTLSPKTTTHSTVPQKVEAETKCISTTTFCLPECCSVFTSYQGWKVSRRLGLEMVSRRIFSVLFLRSNVLLLVLRPNILASILRKMSKVVNLSSQLVDQLVVHGRRFLIELEWIIDIDPKR